VRLIVDLGQLKDKSGSYHNLKTQLNDQLRVRLRLCVRRVDLSQHKIKVVIIKVFKLDSRVNHK